jgi:hypothetical protein
MRGKPAKKKKEKTTVKIEEIRTWRTMETERRAKQNCTGTNKSKFD